jgi:hypothetical protein
VTYNKVGQDDIKCSVKLPSSIKAIGPYGQGSNAAIILTAKQDAAQIFNSRTQVKNSKTYNFPSDINLIAQNDLTPEGKYIYIYTYIYIYMYIYIYTNRSICI